MSKASRLKKTGQRKDKRLQAMRADEQRRHAESGIGHSASRLEPHIGHTRKQAGHPLTH